MLLISIPTPCHEKWNEMTPDGLGAFCKACSKTVVDFTSLSDEEVQNYFLSKKGEKTCGRFRNDQLTDADDPLVRILADSIPFWKKFLAIVLIVFGSFLTGCTKSTKGKIEANILQPVTESFTTTGITLTEISEVSLVGKPEIEECEMTKGEMERILVGDTILQQVIIEETMGIPELPAILQADKKYDENGSEIRENE